jgi:methylamine dehydrogenase accessory protein MauD
MTLQLVSHIGLWVMVTLLLVVVFTLARQIGMIHSRIGPAVARITYEGPTLGDPAPVFEVTDVEGRKITLGGQQQMMTLLLFVSPGCSACTELMPAAGSFRRSEGHYLRTVLVSISIDVQENRKFVERYARDMVFVVSQEVGHAYGIVSPPHAVLIGTDGTVKAKGLVNNLEHLESLLTAARMGYPSIEAYMHALRTEKLEGFASSEMAVGGRVAS